MHKLWLGVTRRMRENNVNFQSRNCGIFLLDRGQRPLERFTNKPYIKRTILYISRDTYTLNMRRMTLVGQHTIGCLHGDSWGKWVNVPIR